MTQKAAKTLADETVQPVPSLKCGVIMPISSLGDYPESHWGDVYAIIRDAVSDAGLEASLVSYADESAFIHKTIVQNLYDNPIVICDVSGKNPNVMFELGLRLAFDKPTIVVKDNATTYSFDTGPIEHIPYPKDLRFAKIVEFKKKLADKVTATLKASRDPNYSTFLKHFGKFTVAKLEEKEVSGQEFLFEELKDIKQALAQLKVQRVAVKSPAIAKTLAFRTNSLSPDEVANLAKLASTLPGTVGIKLPSNGSSHLNVEIRLSMYDETRLAILSLRNAMWSAKGIDPTTGGQQSVQDSTKTHE